MRSCLLLRWVLLWAMAWIAAPAMAQEPAAPLAASSTDSVARQQLQAVLQDPMFSHWQLRQDRELQDVKMSLDPLEFIDLYTQPAQDMVQRFFKWLFGNRSSSPQSSAPAGSWELWSFATILKTLGWVVAGICLLLLLWFVLSRWLGRRKSAVPVAITRQVLDKALDAGDALVASSDVWTSHAMTLAKEKNLRLAYRAMYLSLLSGLHSQGRIRYRAQQTNWFCVLSFQGHSEHKQSFTRLTSQFDDVWYGLQEPDPASLDDLRHRIDSLLRSQPERSPAA